MVVSRRMVLHFPGYLVDQPVIFRLVKDFNLEFNILRASVDTEEGLMILEIKGEEEDFERGLSYLRERGVKVQPLSQGVIFNEEKCTHCGICTIICPSGALEMDRESFKVSFKEEKCLACSLCIKTCPARAMEAKF